jgi:hypothetical protein
LKGIAISVKDTGIGITEEKIKERLFKAFSQMDSSTTRQYGGSGLGLAISKKLAILMGGDLTVDSEVGKGSTFTFQFVVSLPDVLPSAQAAHPQTREDNPVLVSKGECFIFDTWTISRQVFVEHFTSFGFTCKLVETIDQLPQTATFAISELDEDSEEMSAKIKQTKALFKIAVCRLRSPNEVRTEPGIDAIVSRHIKRDSLRNIVDQLLKSGNTIQPTTRTIP